MNITKVRFRSYVEPPSGGATVSELDAERHGVTFTLDGAFVLAAQGEARCAYPLSNCARLGLEKQKRRGRPRKS